MGLAAEFIADEFGVTREAMDRYALCSHQKAVAAQDSRQVRQGDRAGCRPGAHAARRSRSARDESPRRDTSLDALARLTPAFRPDGRVTAGNAPGLNDAAAAVVVASRRKADAMGCVPTGAGRRVCTGGGRAEAHLCGAGRCHPASADARWLDASDRST